MSATKATGHQAARDGGPGTRSPGTRPVLARSASQVLPSPTATPLTTAMVLLLMLAALLLRTHPTDLSAVVAWASTNLHNLAHHPVAAMLISTFVVPGSLFPNVAIVAVSFTVLERAVGAGRTAVIALSGHVIATLLTEYGADLGAQWHLLADSSAQRPDVGVSYVMYSVLAASVLLLTARAKLAGVLIVSCGRPLGSARWRPSSRDRGRHGR
jgi:hypothetical protein